MQTQLLDHDLQNPLLHLCLTQLVSPQIAMVYATCKE